MESFGYNKLYLTRNGKPWLPVMGEMPFSRTRREDWKTSLYKMKAGGVEIVQSYIVWIHHEEIENEWDFSGNRCLRDFLEEIKNAGLYAFLRVGPWIHGEVRNGGFPDWMLEKDWQLRCDDEKYLAKVREYFGKLYEQAKGYFLSDGGPIIGVQIENEYGHCRSANCGTPHNEHMLTLKAMLQEIGFNVPFYTSTGWGGALTGDTIPTWGGYCDHPWCPEHDELPPNPNYVFTDDRNDGDIGNEASYNSSVKVNMKDFPYCTSELGGGIHCSEIRRPLVAGTDIGAMTLCKFGSGMNLFGYYVYHGGTNPVGKLSFLNEYDGCNWVSGCTSNVLELSYDFQAPIDEFGKIRDAYKEIKLFALFLKDFGADMATLPAVFPDDNSPEPENLDNMRYCFRKDDSHGYLFVNAYQRRYKMTEFKDVEICVRLHNEEIKLPKFDLHDKDYFFWPFNMKIGNSLLKSANASPLCLLNGKTYLFYKDRDDREVVYNFEGAQDKNTEIITLSKQDALNAYRIDLDKDYLFISDSVVMKTDKGVELHGYSQPEFKVYPDLAEAPKGFVKKGTDGAFVCYEKQIEIPECKAVFEKSDNGRYLIKLDYPSDISDAVLSLVYAGNKAKLYNNEGFAADNFYNCGDWNLSMKYLGFPKELVMEIEAVKSEDCVFFEKPVNFINGVANTLNEVKIKAELVTVF